MLFTGRSNLEMYELTVPKMGMDTTEVEILKWMIKVGDNIKKGDPVAEIEFEKATTEIESEVSGAVEEILYKEGDIVNVGSVIARIKND
jgi:pyruvate/2-oxoglutarate dehydrogenase complex dihydrolipoamide acyltransferase (E2) component